MTAVAALGVYRAYRHTMHDRVMSYLGLQRFDADGQELDEPEAGESSGVPFAKPASHAQPAAEVELRPSHHTGDQPTSGVAVMPT